MQFRRLRPENERVEVFVVHLVSVGHVFGVDFVEVLLHNRAFPSFRVLQKSTAIAFDHVESIHE